MRRTIVTSFLLLAACGGGAETTEETAATEETTGGEASATAWADMNPEQRGEYMASVVLPRMRAVFDEYDSERFSDFGCATCHGENAREVGFEMPNGLHPLNQAEIPAMFASDDAEQVRFAQFMAGPVMQTMAELLGEQPYDPETHQGFGCMNCHAAAE